MTQKELAEALGITQAAVSKLARRGMPTDSVERASRWRRRHLQTGRMKGIRRDTVQASTPAQPGEETPPPATPEDADLFEDPDEDEDETRVRKYREARDMREHYQAEMAKMTYMKEAGQLVLASDMARVVADAGTTIRIGLEGLPAQIAPHLMHKTEQQVEALLLQEIERLLESLSRKFSELSRGAQA
jgi:phage terminase Nu1 subunit (DNA packaging protein)